MVTAGNLDSMVANYTAEKKPRRDDAYSPGGEGGRRPDRAAIVYANLVRRAYKKMPLIVGGVEASLRRLAHNDSWSDSLRRSLPLDAKADILVHGMAELTIIEIARRMDAGIDIREINNLPGTVVRASPEDLPEGTLQLPVHDTLKKGLPGIRGEFSHQDLFWRRAFLPGATSIPGLTTEPGSGAGLPQ